MSFPVYIIRGVEITEIGEFTSGDTVLKVKQVYYERISNEVPVNELRFSYYGKEMANHKKLEYYEDDVNPGHGMMIYVVFRCMGGDPNVIDEVKDDAKDDIKDDVFKPVVTYKYKSICDHLKSISNVKPTKLDNEMKKEFNKYKEYATIMGRPLVILNNNNDNTNYNDCGLLNTVGLNTDINTFDKNKFIKDYCRINGLHKSQIKILSIKEGSTVIEIYITNTEHYEIDLNKFRDKQATDPSIHAALKKIGAFCTLFDEPKIKRGWKNQQKFRDSLIFNAQYNRIYGKGNITWNGDLKDGKDRGNKPYYCPNGWQKRAVSYKCLIKSDDFDAKFKGWPIAYHGTTFEFGMSMLLSGMIPSIGGNHGRGLYLTPSITYAAHPRYAEPKELTSDQQSKLNTEGKWIQFAFQVRVNPNAIKTIKEETFYIHRTKGFENYKIDPNYDNSELEWVVGETNIEDPSNPNCKVFIVGIMIRITNGHPYLLNESKWWETYPYNISISRIIGLKVLEQKLY